MTFEQLHLNPHILSALEDMRFTTCTPIQERCIPAIMDGNDVLGIAQTGTGKTAAYLLPILNLLDDYAFPRDAVNCLIMSPTRELAQQIDQAMQGFAFYLDDIGSLPIYGGNDGTRFEQEKRSLRLGADVIIATPGRFLSHVKMGNVNLARTSFFILDEADRMLDMGFSQDILNIAKLLPPTCQTIMFSATMPADIEQLAHTLLHHPTIVKISPSRPAENIMQAAYVCHENQKAGIIRHLFGTDQLKRVIIFADSKQKVKELALALRQMRINCAEMHSDLAQTERDRTMLEFKAGRTDVLVATDIVARGIDIDDIAIVINYDVPHDPEDYVHRVGRTARASRHGKAITLVRGKEIRDFMAIEKFLRREVEKLEVPNHLGPTPPYTVANSAQRGRRGKQKNAGRHNNKTTDGVQRKNKKKKRTQPSNGNRAATSGNTARKKDGK